MTTETQGFTPEFLALWRQRQTLTGEARLVHFRTHIMPLFGPADPDTIAFRKRCRELGADVVFPHGLSEEEVLRILDDPEVQEALRGDQPAPRRLPD